jgi:hypothetical protein
MTLKLSTKKQNIMLWPRKEEETKGSLCAISIPQFDWVEETRIEWKQDQGH